MSKPKLKNVSCMTGLNFDNWIQNLTLCITKIR